MGKTKQRAGKAEGHGDGGLHSASLTGVKGDGVGKFPVPAPRESVAGISGLSLQWCGMWKNSANKLF